MSFEPQSAGSEGPDQLKAELQSLAQQLGFAAMGVARAEPLSEEGERLRAWLAAGHHGDLDYMARTAEVRIDPRHAGMLPGAASIVVLATQYGAGPATDLQPGRVARYARDRDYHNVLHRRLRKLAKLLRDAGHITRAAVDSMPVFERAWAQRAGIGFVGKNCCLIVPGLGSHLFLSALITTAGLPPDPPMAPRCGDCEACLVACPTAAFVGPGRLDARRCISYQTIENPGAVPESLRPAIDDWLFGCDVCQEVCPYNRAARALESDSAFAVARELPSAEALLEMTAREIRDALEGSPVRRPGREGLARNAAIVLGNRGERRHLPVLRRVAQSDDSEMVREAAHWASERIRGRG